MRVQAFITSGVLEKYVLGMATGEEKTNVLEMASQHLEIKEELAAIRKTMRGYIISHRVAPPADLFEKVKSVTNKQSASVSRTDAATRSASPTVTTVKRDHARRGSNQLMPIGLGLLSIALIAVSFTAYSFFNDLKMVKQEVVDAQEVVEGLKKELATEQTNTREVQAKLDFYLDPDNQILTLKGTNRAPQAKAVIFWNDKSKTCALEKASLPKLDDGNVAVVWSNKPYERNSIKLGVLTPNAATERIPLTYIENPSLLYVTEENSADVDRPNRSKILMTGG